MKTTKDRPAARTLYSDLIRNRPSFLTGLASLWDFAGALNRPRRPSLRWDSSRKRRACALRKSPAPGESRSVMAEEDLASHVARQENQPDVPDAGLTVRVDEFHGPLPPPDFFE